MITEHFYRGFEKRAHQKEAESLEKVANPLLALGAGALRVLGKPIMAAGRALFGSGKMGVAMAGMTGMDIASGAQKGMQMADAGKGAYLANRIAGATV